MASAAGFLPELDVARVQRWCEGRVPEHARHQVRVECEVNGSYLTIVECRAPWRDDFGPDWTRLPVARLRYTKASRTWTLYRRDRNLRFHRYDRINPSENVSTLIDEIDREGRVGLPVGPTAVMFAADAGAFAAFGGRRVEVSALALRQRR